MSNINATEGNVESPSTYGQEGYRAYRKQEKKKQEERNYKSNFQTDNYILWVRGAVFPLVSCFYSFSA